MGVALWRVGTAVPLFFAALALVAGCAGAPSVDGTSPRADASVGRLLSQTSPDGHRLREVRTDQAPSVELEVSEDSDSGWNIHLRTEGFEFTPAQVGGEARPGGGHAHLYVDGEKVARLYAPWYHLAASAVPDGEHTLMVQLNANDHSAWATDGAVVSASTTIRSTEEGGGHGSHNHGHADDPPGDEDPQSPDPAAQADVEVRIRIANGEVIPPPDRVAVSRGDRVRIEVESDRADTIHVHGFDVEGEVESSAPAVLEFTADQSGLFEVETHDSGLQLAQLQVE